MSKTQFPYLAGIPKEVHNLLPQRVITVKMTMDLSSTVTATVGKSMWLAVTVWRVPRTGVPQHREQGRANEAILDRGSPEQ